MFTPKDKLGDWFEAYASLMELNAWTSTKVCSAEYHEKQKVWTVEVERADGSKRKLSPRHIVFCTGHAGEPLVPNFPGQGSFKGEVYHGSQHQDASFSGDLQGKKVVVVGTGNSGHDIAQNFYENGADVTMLQRRGTYVITAKTGLFMLHKGMYDEDSPPTEDVDIVAQSLPIPVQFALNTSLTKRITEAEKETLDGLTKAGFALDFGRDGSGIFRKYMTRGGGYYIDVGCSQLIIDGKIKVVQSPGGIAGFTEHAIQLADGSVLPADIVVLATGYDNMRTSVRKILGDKVADRCHDVWDLNEEGELNAVSISTTVVICYADSLSRSGAAVGILDSGTWEGTLRFVVFILSFLPCRSKLLRRACSNNCRVLLLH
jgi:cation diffusion facilitator CzcD-associated flavoprotein CzcO